MQCADIQSTLRKSRLGPTRTYSVHYIAATNHLCDVYDLVYKHEKLRRRTVAEHLWFLICNLQMYVIDTETLQHISLSITISIWQLWMIWMFWHSIERPFYWFLRHCKMSRNWAIWQSNNVGHCPIVFDWWYFQCLMPGYGVLLNFLEACHRL